MNLSFSPRKYQLEILEHAMNYNTLAFLPTGSGKTFISVLLIKHHLIKIKKNIENGLEKKLIAFLAPTKILVGQQEKYLSGNTDSIVKSYTGDTRSNSGSILDNWGVDTWLKELNEVDIMIMTPEIMRNILEKNLISLSKFQLLILDECHHAFGKDPMAAVCKFIQNSNYNIRPNILGLTASPLACKKGSINQKINELEKNTGCKLVTPVESLLDLNLHVPKPQLSILYYNDENFLKSSVNLEQIINNFQNLTLNLNNLSFYFYDDYKNNSNIMSLLYSNIHQDILPQLNPVHFLYHTYYRIRHGQHLQEIIILLNTLRTDLSNLPELISLNQYIIMLRQSEEKYRQSFSSSPPLYIFDLEIFIGQLTKIFCDCGLLTGLYAIISGLTTNIQEVKSNLQKDILQPTKIIEHGFIWRSENEQLNNSIQTFLPSVFSITRIKRERQRHSESYNTTTSIDMVKYINITNELLSGPFLNYNENNDNNNNHENIDIVICNPNELLLVTLFDLLAFILFSIDKKTCINGFICYKHFISIKFNNGENFDDILEKKNWIYYVTKLYELIIQFNYFNFEKQPQNQEQNQEQEQEQEYNFEDIFNFKVGSGGIFYSSLFQKYTNGIKITTVNDDDTALLYQLIYVCQTLLDSLSIDHLISIIMESNVNNNNNNNEKNNNEKNNKNDIVILNIEELIEKRKYFELKNIPISPSEENYQLISSKDIVTNSNSNNLNSITLPDCDFGTIDDNLKEIVNLKYIPIESYLPSYQTNNNNNNNLIKNNIENDMNIENDKENIKHKKYSNYFYLLSPRVCMLIRDLCSRRAINWEDLIEWEVLKSIQKDTLIGDEEINNTLFENIHQKKKDIQNDIDNYKTNLEVSTESDNDNDNQDDCDDCDDINIDLNQIVINDDNDSSTKTNLDLFNEINNSSNNDEENNNDNDENDNEEDNDNDNDNNDNINDLLQNSKENEWAAIVFCKMKLTVIAMSSLVSNLMDKIAQSTFLETNQQKNNNIKCNYKIRCDHLIGGYHMNIQGKKLLEFKSGVYNVLFATDIAEEGLDVRSCQRVINFDIPVTVKSYVQRRGRARASNSIMINLIPNGIHGKSIYDELLVLLKQEAEMNEYEGNSDNFDTTHLTKKFFEEIIQSKQINDNYDSIENNNNNYNYNYNIDLEYPIDTTLPNPENEIQKYVVPTTHAYVDVINATQLLFHYCKHIPHDKYYSPDPIYWISTKKAITYNLNSSTYIPSTLFQCSILLPPYVHPKIRCMNGPIVTSKSLAKSLISLECIKKLHLYGEIDDYLQSINSKSSIERRKNQLKKLIQIENNQKIMNEKEELINNSNIENKDNKLKKDENNPEAITRVDIKISPDILEFLNESYENHEFYFYQFDTKCTNPLHVQYIQNCPTCSRYVKSMNLFGIIYHQPISKEILNETIDFYIRGLRIDTRLSFIGSKKLSLEEIFYLQQFHRNILCWESDKLENFNDNEEYFTPNSIISPIEWMKSGSNSWYLIYPRYDNNLNDNKITFSLTNNYTTEIELIQSSDWLNCLKYYCKQTFTLISNLLKHQIKTTKMQNQNIKINNNINDNKVEIETQIKSYELNLNQKPEDLYEKLYSRGGYGNIYIGCKSNDFEENKILDDIMKYITIPINSKLENDNLNKNETEAETETEINQAITFREYFLSKQQITELDLELIEQSIKLTNTSSVELIKSASLAGRLSLVQILDQVVTNSKVMEQEHTHTLVSYLLPQQCQIIGEVKWMLIGLVAPSMIWRIQSLLLALEVRDKIYNLMPPCDTLKNIQSYYTFQKLINDNNNNNIIDNSNNNINDIDSNEMEIVNKISIRKEYCLPSPRLILKALTPRMTNEILDSERLEFLGDVILKYIVTWMLYCTYIDQHEGFLTRARVDIICNSFLTNQCRNLDILQYLRAHSLSTGKQELLFSPPGRLYTFKYNNLFNSIINSSNNLNSNNNDNHDNNNNNNNNDNNNLNFSLWNVNILKPFNSSINNEIINNNKRSNKHFIANVKAKRIADMLEALIGVFHESGGIECAIGVIRAFGLCPTNENLQILYPIRNIYSDNSNNSQDNNDNNNILLSKNILPPDVPLNYPPQLKNIAIGPLYQQSNESNMSNNNINMNNNYNTSKISITLSTVDAIAKKIGYKFKNISLLDEALTHCSVLHKQSNQRLEYLGDAVLEYCTILLCYSSSPSLTPGQLSKIKNLYLCNFHLSKIVLKLKLFLHLSNMSLKLITTLNDIKIFHEINKLETESQSDKEINNQEEYDKEEYDKEDIGKIKENDDKNNNDNMKITEEENKLYEKILNYIDGKFLADILEALLGAIFIDSECDINTVCNVIKFLQILPSEFINEEARN